MRGVDVLTSQFYAWERRGRGWLLWDEPVELEPPFRPFFVPSLASSAETIDDGRRPTFLSRLTDRMFSGGKTSDVEAELEPSEEPEPDRWYGHSEISELLVAVPPDLDVVRESAEHLLLARQDAPRFRLHLDDRGRAVDRGRERHAQEGQAEDEDEDGESFSLIWSRPTRRNGE